MRKSECALIAAALLALLAGGLASAAAATPGYAAYKVEVSYPGYTYALTVNETVAATSSPATDNLILKIAAQTWNLNYSRSINSSDLVSPFLPSITNQSLSFGTSSGKVTASIADTGTTQLQFGGHSYSLTDYSLALAASYNGTSTSTNGTISTFPSGLIYSLTASTALPAFPTAGFPGLSSNMTGISGGFSGLTAASGGLLTLSVTLLSTSLPLNASSPSTAAQDASIGIGAGAAVSALALGLGVRHHNKVKAQAPEKKPEYWVD